MSKKVKIEKEQDTTDSALSRRSFIDKLWWFLGIVAFAELLWVVLSFLSRQKAPARRGRFGSMIEAGPVDSFEKNSVTAFARGRFYLVRLEDGGFLALHRQCTHLGCTVPWDDEQRVFVCPCHSSAFDIRGEVIRSPAPRALDLFPITIENNLVWVDTNKKTKRSRFSAEQVQYPEKGF
jgi:cytochrome b6-f complex iron-sulfur subunit